MILRTPVTLRADRLRTDHLDPTRSHFVFSGSLPGLIGHKEPLDFMPILFDGATGQILEISVLLSQFPQDVTNNEHSQITRLSSRADSVSICLNW